MISDSKSRKAPESDQCNHLEWLPTYLADITRYKVEGPDEVHRLIVKVSDGDTSSREKLINAHLYYAYCVAKRHHLESPFVPLEDMLQEANLALVESIDTFELAQSTPFACHLCKNINHACEQVVDELFSTAND